MGGKGGSTQSSTGGTSNTSGTSSTQLPSWLTGAAQQAVGTAQTLSQDPNLFSPYPGQQVTDVSPGTQAGWNYGTATDPNAMAGQIGGAAGNIYQSIAGMGLPQAQQYLQGGINNATQSVYGGINNGMSLLGPWVNSGPTAQQIAQNAQSMMSPYTQAVIDPTMALGKQALQQQLQTVGANANQAGAFGGSRQGVQEGVAQSQAALGESNILGQLLNTGYNQALGVAGTMGLNAQQNAYAAANQLAQMQYGGNNILAQMQANAGGNMAGYNQADIASALQTGSGLPQQYFQNLLGIGTGQQAQQQAGLNAQMGNYYAQQQQPIQNLDLLLSAVTGVPYGTTGSTTGTGATTGTGTGSTDPGTGNQVASGIGTAAAVAGTVAMIV